MFISGVIHEHTIKTQAFAQKKPLRPGRFSGAYRKLERAAVHEVDGVHGFMGWMDQDALKRRHFLSIQKVKKKPY